jgi:hypothetical protein
VLVCFWVCQADAARHQKIYTPQLSEGFLLLNVSRIFSSVKG